MERKTVTIRGTKYRMHQASTGWVFVESKKARQTFSVGLVCDGEIVEIENPDALRYASNAELLAEWLKT